MIGCRAEAPDPTLPSSMTNLVSAFFPLCGCAQSLPEPSLGVQDLFASQRN